MKILMLRIVLAFAVGVLILPLTGWLYFRFGYAPVATAAPPILFEKQLAHMALMARIQKEAPTSSPMAANEEAYTAGVDVYRTHCAICHGLPGQPASATAKGMYPRPPLLFKGIGVSDDPAGMTYWKVANGIRLTGMPAYRTSLSENEMWQVSLLLANSDKLSPQVRSLLDQPFRERQ